MAKTYTAKRKGTRVTTGMVRLSYAHLLEAKAISEGQDPKFSVSLIIPKTDKDTLTALKEAIAEAKEYGKTSKFKGKIPAGLKSPVRDGDEERPDDDAYANSYFLNANSTQKPQVVGLKGEKIDPEDIYSGMYARVSINFFPYATGGNQGIGAGLGNVQKVDDGERLGGGETAANDFDIDEDDDEYEF